MDIQNKIGKLVLLCMEVSKSHDNLATTIIDNITRVVKISVVKNLHNEEERCAAEFTAILDSDNCEKVLDEAICKLEQIKRAINLLSMLEKSASNVIVNLINGLISLLNSRGHYIADGNDNTFRLSRIVPYIDTDGYYFETEDNE